MSGADTRNQLHNAGQSTDKLVRQTFEHDIGLEEVEIALQFAAQDDDPAKPPSPAQRLLDMMHDPAFALANGRPTALTTLMKQADITWPELADMCRKKDALMALVSSGRRLGAVVDGLGEFAEPTWEICRECGGEGRHIAVDDDGKPSLLPADIGEDTLPELVRCLGCDGTGKVRRMGNLDAAKLFLEAQGIRKGSGGGGTNIELKVQQNNVNGGANDRRQPQQESVTARVQSILEKGE